MMKSTLELIDVKICKRLILRMLLNREPVSYECLEKNVKPLLRRLDIEDCDSVFETALTALLTHGLIARYVDGNDNNSYRYGITFKGRMALKYVLRWI